MGNCYNSIVINTDPEEAWNALRNFHDMSWASEIITSVVKVGDKQSDEIGAKRILNNAFHESLLELDDPSMSFEYSIDDGPGPVSKDAVSDYIGRVRVAPVTANGQTFVEWSSNYQSPDDSSVGELCNPIYQALLQALKAHLES